MSQSELLSHTVRGLEAAGIHYMLTGSIVSSAQGEPRATHDIDVVVHLRKPDIPALIQLFPEPRYYLSMDAIIEAIDHASQFNVLDIETGDKVDFWMLTESPFDQERFERRSRQLFLGREMFASTPEDTILQKLSWAKASGGSERQFGDAKAILEVQHPTLDFSYLDRWADRLDVRDQWARLRREATLP